MSRKRRKMKSLVFRDIELNIMPFVDVFSLLNTFLLFSAVFLSIGIIEVQVPFLTNAPPEKTEKTRDFTIKVDILPDKIQLITSWTMAPVDEKKEEFPLTPQGADELHVKLIAARTQNKETDKLTVFSEDEIAFEKLTMVLDAIKFLKPGEPRFQEVDPKTNERRDTDYLYPKVILGSVLL